MSGPVPVELPSVEEPGRMIQVDAASVRRVTVMSQNPPNCLVQTERGSGYVAASPDQIWTALLTALDESERESPMVEAVRDEIPTVRINRARPEYVVAIHGPRGAHLIWPGGMNLPGLVVSFLLTGAPKPLGPHWDTDAVRRPLGA